MSPVKQVADVRQYLYGRARLFIRAKRGEAFGRVSDGFTATIGKRRQSVAQHLSFQICDRVPSFIHSFYTLPLIYSSFRHDNAPHSFKNPLARAPVGKL